MLFRGLSERCSPRPRQSGRPLALLGLQPRLSLPTSDLTASFTLTPPLPPPSIRTLMIPRGFPGGSDRREPTCKAGDAGSTPGSERSPGEASGNPLHYSCLENSKDKGARRATVHGVAKSWTRLRKQTHKHWAHLIIADNLLTQKSSVSSAMIAWPWKVTHSQLQSGD